MKYWEFQGLFNTMEFITGRLSKVHMGACGSPNTWFHRSLWNHPLGGHIVHISLTLNKYKCQKFATPGRWKDCRAIVFCLVAVARDTLNIRRVINLVWDSNWTILGHLLTYEPTAVAWGKEPAAKLGLCHTFYPSGRRKAKEISCTVTSKRG